MNKIPDIQFFKKNMREIEIETISLETLFVRRHKLDNLLEKDHRVHFYHIMLITKGKGVHRIDLEPYSYSEGSLIFVSKGQVHAFDPQFSSKGIIIIFTEKFLIKNLIYSDILYLHRLFNYHLHNPVINGSEYNTQELISIISDMHSEYHSLEEFGKEEMLRAQLKILLLKTERIKRSIIVKNSHSKSHISKLVHSNFIDIFTRLRQLIERNYAKTRNAQDYASWLNISPKQLNEICKTITDKTSKEFIDSFIILEIKRMLSISSLAVKELTYQFGFDEPTNFLKYFKKHTGQTPSEFRITHFNRSF
ncbi:MAG: helix-turn-helix domain-containing protein [Desulfamplus sp.]|nr:helix-turn-helix domain-containing protein [Desulfamplus sp.]